MAAWLGWVPPSTPFWGVLPSMGGICLPYMAWQQCVDAPPSGVGGATLPTDAKLHSKVHKWLGGPGLALGHPIQSDRIISIPLNANEYEISRNATLGAFHQTGGTGILPVVLSPQTRRLCHRGLPPFLGRKTLFRVKNRQYNCHPVRQPARFAGPEGEGVRRPDPIALPEKSPCRC